MSTSHSGNVQNVVNHGILTERVSTFGVKYNPVRPEFTIQQLIDLKVSGETVLGIVNAAENADKKSGVTRGVAFENVEGVVTNSINAFRISGAPEQAIQQAESLVREFRAVRASDKPTEEEKATAKAEGKELKTNVLHNSTIDSKIENLGNYVRFLMVRPEYRPYETDITIEALTAKLAELKMTNSECNKTAAALTKARMDRDVVLYTDTTGLVDIALGVKLYVKSAFGATSPEYKSISKLKFTKPR